MIYYPNIHKHRDNARLKLECLIHEGRAFEINGEEFKRTYKQNKSIHLYCTIVSDELNRMGIEYCVPDINVGLITVIYTPHIVKEEFWRPIQIAMYGVKSSTELLMDQVGHVADGMINFFARKGVYVEFPTKDLMISEELEREQKNNNK